MNINENFKSSLKALDGPIHNFEDLRYFFDKQNEKSNFETKEIGIQNLKEWSFDSQGNLSHKSGKFFKVTGVVNETLKTGIFTSERNRYFRLYSIKIRWYYAFLNTV